MPANSAYFHASMRIHGAAQDLKAMYLAQSSYTSMDYSEQENIIIFQSYDLCNPYTINPVIYAVILFMQIMQVVVRAHK